MNYSSYDWMKGEVDIMIMVAMKIGDNEECEVKTEWNTITGRVLMECVKIEKVKQSE